MCAPLLCCIWIKIAYFNKKGDYFNKKERFDAQVDKKYSIWTKNIYKNCPPHGRKAFVYIGSFREDKKNCQKNPM